MNSGVRSVGESQTGSGFSTLFRQGFAAQGIFLVLALGFLFGIKFLSLFMPSTGDESSWELGIGIAGFSLPFALGAILVHEFYVMARVDKPKSPIKGLWLRMKRFFSDPYRMALGLPLFAALVVFMFAFTLAKAKITAFVPFAWDQYFDQLDRTLHFGYRPWEIFHPIFANVVGTFLLNLNYNLWFLVMNLFWVHHAFFAAPGVQRTRFFLTFMLIWIVGGSVLATFFSSAGPCYFERLGFGAEAYGPLMQHLRHVNQIAPIWALDAQDMLWNLKQQGSAFGGVSAMPSMHNATALLFVLMSWRQGGWVRNLMIAHCSLIYVGSVHLGWHYAVDAYASWALACLCWLASKPIAVWWNSRATVQTFNFDFAGVAKNV